MKLSPVKGVHQVSSMAYTRNASTTARNRKRAASDCFMEQAGIKNAVRN